MVDLDYIYEHLEEYIQEAEQQVELPQYPLALNITATEGSYLIDDKGNKYLDLTSNKDSQPLGFGCKFESNSFINNSGLFSTSYSGYLDNEFKILTGLDNIFFTSSTVESYKLVQDVVQSELDKNSKDRVLVVSSDRAKYSFANCDYLPINNDTVLRSVFTKSVGAVIVDIVQITETVEIAYEEYLKELRLQCDNNNALLIFDVTSVSPYRMGETIFNYAKDINPDGVIISENISNGMPFGVFTVSDKVSTFNQLQNANVALSVDNIKRFINIKSRNEIIKNIESKSKYIEEKLTNLVGDKISNVAVSGMLATFTVEFNAYTMVKKCVDKGLLIQALSANRILLTPNYFITEDELNSAFDTIESSITEL